MILIIKLWVKYQRFLVPDKFKDILTISEVIMSIIIISRTFTMIDSKAMD